jgi:hypothetical protein
MDESKIIIGGKKVARAQVPVDPRHAWTTLAGLGFLILTAGIVDLGLGVMPIRWEAADWRFAIGIAAVGSWPLFVLGVTMITMAGVGSGAVRVLRLGLVFSLALFLVLLVILVAIVAARGTTMAAAPVELHSSLNRSFVKALLTGCAYLGVLGLAFWSTGRSLRSAPAD